ncbi:isochorismate synthase [Sporolactobacillus spathodeae]|uniref:isochorismate synthase n=1 Tax=Sporolactobacillus spathodeae TaxID=1465502 RepID=A0ABS2Q815_9BACL|nr:isochorismate synthase [Sporolactobacillus spathodeae]MBM7657932.1 menaquinone-specific isochorismate synthase [Sporolactobacillus spathodeae]
MNVINVCKTVKLDGLTEAAKQAKAVHAPVLFSFAEIMETEDPFSFFAKGSSLSSGKRFIFGNEEMMIAGLGAACTFSATGNQRFDRVKRDWQQAAERLVLRAQPGAETGKPMLVGGFSFDPEAAHSSLWAPFADALFYLPAWFLRVQNQQVILTHSMICRPGVPLEQLVAQFSREEERFRLAKPISSFETEKRSSIFPLQDRESWRELVTKAIVQMHHSDLRKIVLARTLQADLVEKPDLALLLKRLADRQKGSYLFCLETPEGAFLGATPERLIKKQGATIETACVAGSAPRGDTKEADMRLAAALLADPKNCKEHHYVVTMITSELRKFAQTVDWPDQPQILKNKNIQHLYTPVHAVADPSVSIFDLLQTLHPTPALGGLPQADALNWLRTNEAIDRGFYGAPIGWCDCDGNGEFVVGIRSALFAGCRAVLYAGCGVIEGSNPDSEFTETALKFRPILDVLPGENE